MALRTQARTAFLSKLLGIYCVLYALSMFAHKRATVDAVSALVQNPAALLVIGAVVLGVGVAFVLGHNFWSGGALTIVVTVVAWLTLLKGIALVFALPTQSAAAYLAALHYEQLFYLYAVVTLALGAYLTYEGFMLARTDGGLGAQND